MPSASHRAQLLGGGDREAVDPRGGEEPRARQRFIPLTLRLPRRQDVDERHMFFLTVQLKHRITLLFPAWRKSSAEGYRSRFSVIDGSAATREK